MCKEPHAENSNNNHIYLPILPAFTPIFTPEVTPKFTPLLPPLRSNVKQWNETAKDCYNLGCSCKDCFIYKTYFYNTDETCKMKYYVYSFLKKLGAPEEKLA